MALVLSYGPDLSIARRLKQFLGELQALAGDVRLLWVAGIADTTTSTTKDLTARTVTWDATVAPRLSTQGFGALQTFTSASSQYGTLPDTANLSPGNATVDGPLSVIALANVTDTAVSRVIFAKDNRGATNGEYEFWVDESGRLHLSLVDASVPIESWARYGPIIMGSITLFGATYSAATGGATAANDISLYQNAALLSPTRNSGATYVAMEDLTLVPTIGRDNGAVNYMEGSLGFVLVSFTNLVAQDHWNIKELVNYYYGLTL